MLRNALRGLAFAALLAAWLPAAPLPPSLQLIGTSGTVGDGNLLVTIGQTGGWGFQLANDAAGWLVVTATDFCPGGIFISPCSNSFGPYTDLAGPAFLVLAPNGSVQQSFGGGAGIGSIGLTNAGILPGDSIARQDLPDLRPLRRRSDCRGQPDRVQSATFLRCHRHRRCFDRHPRASHLGVAEPRNGGVPQTPHAPLMRGTAAQ